MTTVERGDSGSGFVVLAESAYYLRGLVSTNKYLGGDTKKIPTFTDVSNYIDWLRVAKKEIECKIANRTESCM